MAAFSRADFRDFIPTFDGNEAELNHFFICVDTMHNDLDDDGKKKLMIMLKYKMNGETIDLYMAGGFDNWAELRTILKNKYKPPAKYDELIDQLKVIKQKPGERVYAYAYRIKSVFALLEIATNEKFVEATTRAELSRENHAIATKVFKNGLNYNIQAVVKSVRNNTLAEAIAIAIEEEGDLPRAELK